MMLANIRRAIKGGRIQVIFIHSSYVTNSGSVRPSSASTQSLIGIIIGAAVKNKVKMRCLRI